MVECRWSFLMINTAIELFPAPSLANGQVQWWMWLFWSKTDPSQLIPRILLRLGVELSPGILMWSFQWFMQFINQNFICYLVDNHNWTFFVLLIWETFCCPRLWNFWIFNEPRGIELCSVLLTWTKLEFAEALCEFLIVFTDFPESQDRLKSNFYSSQTVSESLLPWWYWSVVKLQFNSQLHLHSKSI